MSDRSKFILAALTSALAVILAPAAFFYIWLQRDLVTAAIVAAGIFLGFFILAALILFRIKDLSWLGAGLPYLFTSLYAILPDVVPTSLDDGGVALLGALVSSGLAAKRNPATPRWVYLVLVAGGIYMLLGGLIPGPVDELLVSLVSYVAYAYGANRQSEDSQVANRG